MPVPLATTERPAVLDAPAPVDAPSSGCGACAHPASDHDAIGLRYCRATVDSALDRGCICRTS